MKIKILYTPLFFAVLLFSFSVTINAQTIISPTPCISAAADGTKILTATGQTTLNEEADALVNGQALSSFSTFCAGESLDLSVANKKDNATYTWYNGSDIITSNPFVVPASLTEITLRLVAVECPAPGLAAQSDLIQTITTGSSAETAVSVSSGVNETYQWYSNTTASTTGGTLVGSNSTSYSYTPSDAGTMYFYCIVTNGCVGNPKAVSPIFTVTAVNPAVLPIGAGTLSGKTCFDIAESNDGGSCTPLSGRLATKADFSQTATNTQTYTFTPSGAVSKIRFAYVESLEGAIVKSITNNGNEAGLYVSGAVTATVVYKNTLSSTNGAGTGTAFGKTAADALTVDLYVIYNNKADGSGTDERVKLTAKIQDCACCGALIAPNVWKNFMCYNLGANTSLDPMVPNPDLVGDWYLWGNKTPAVKAAVPAYPPAPTVIYATPSIYTATNEWGDGVKGPNDPCPSGYRVPSRLELQGLLSNNTAKRVGTIRGNYGVMYTGTMYGNNLMLPGSGYYDLGSSYTRFYSSTVAGAASYSSGANYAVNNQTTYILLIDTTISITAVNKGCSYSVRCISEN